MPEGKEEGGSERQKAAVERKAGITDELHPEGK